MYKHWNALSQIYALTQNIGIFSLFLLSCYCPDTSSQWGEWTFSHGFSDARGLIFFSFFIETEPQENKLTSHPQRKLIVSLKIPIVLSKNSDSYLWILLIKIAFFFYERVQILNLHDWHSLQIKLYIQQFYMHVFVFVLYGENREHFCWSHTVGYRNKLAERLTRCMYLFL